MAVVEVEIQANYSLAEPPAVLNPLLGWLFRSLDGGNVQQINLWNIYMLGLSIHPLTLISTDATTHSISKDVIWAHGTLKSFSTDSGITIPLAEKVAARLSTSLDVLMQEFSQAGNQDRQITYVEYLELQGLSVRFEHVLAAEFGELDVYFVPSATAYKTTVLIERGEEVIYESLRGSLPARALTDLREATKCLAFGLSTAVGFHILRAVEATIIELMTVLNIPIPTRPIERNLGNYIALLRGAGVDDRILLPLDQIRAFHRNELMHPDRILTPEEASSLFEVSKAALTALLLEIKARTAIALPSAPATPVIPSGPP